MRKYLRKILGCTTAALLGMTMIAAPAGAAEFSPISEEAVSFEEQQDRTDLLGKWTCSARDASIDAFMEITFGEDGTCLLTEYIGTGLTGSFYAQTEYGTDPIPAMLTFTVGNITSRYQVELENGILSLTLAEGYSLFETAGYQMGDRILLNKVADVQGTLLQSVPVVNEDPVIFEEEPVMPELMNATAAEESIFTEVFEEEDSSEGSSQEPPIFEEIVEETEVPEETEEPLMEEVPESEKETETEAETLSQELFASVEEEIEAETQELLTEVLDEPGNLRPDGFYNCSEEILQNIAGIWRSKDSEKFYRLSMGSDGSGFLLWYESRIAYDAEGSQTCKIRYLTKEEGGNSAPEWIEFTLDDVPGEEGYSLYQVEQKNLELTLTLRNGRNFFQESPYTIGDSIVLEKVSGEEGGIVTEMARDGCFMGYVGQYQLNADWMGIDDVEWISGTNTSRIAQLGLSSQIRYNYCIYNPDTQAHNYSLSPNAVIEFYDRGTLDTIQSSLAELKSQEESWGNRVFEVTIAGNMIVKLAEIYTPY